jgi:quinol monooxygenase YgiN
MVCLGVIYDIKDGHEEDAAAFLIELMAATRREPGCRMYLIHRATDDPRRFFIYEQYDDEAALEAHLNSPHFQRYGINGIRAVARNREAVHCMPLGE